MSRTAPDVPNCSGRLQTQSVERPYLQKTLPDPFGSWFGHTPDVSTSGDSQAKRRFKTSLRSSSSCSAKGPFNCYRGQGETIAGASGSGVALLVILILVLVVRIRMQGIVLVEEQIPQPHR